MKSSLELWLVLVRMFYRYCNRIVCCFVEYVTVVSYFDIESKLLPELDEG